jgi:hypothetical protein
MDPTAQAEAMAVEFATSVPVTDDEWLDAARRIIAAIEADLDYTFTRRHGALSHKPPAARLNELNNLAENYS